MTKLLRAITQLIPALTILGVVLLLFVGCSSGVPHTKWEGFNVEDALQNRKRIILLRMEFPPGSKFAKRLFVWREPGGEDVTKSLERADNELEVEWLNTPEEVVALQEDKVVDSTGKVLAEFQGREILRPTLEFYGKTYLRHDMSRISMTMKPVERFSTISEIFHGKE
jgi:hypothetical protein